MTNQEIKRVLLYHGVKHLYHTNTVETSLSFLKARGLLSRGLCIDMGFPQTEQYTDLSDRRNSIFYDIFFDSNEIQRRTGFSSYGPVLFQYSVDVLDTVKEGSIYITKCNPDRCSPDDEVEDRDFTELHELEELYDEWDFGQHVTLKDQITPLSFDYLEKIIISDPQKEDNSLYETAFRTIGSLINKYRIHVDYIRRNYNYKQRFVDKYNQEYLLNKHYKLGGYEK